MNFYKLMFKREKPLILTRSIANFFVFVSFIFVFFGVLPSVANAASLDLSPATGIYGIGDIFSVNIIVNSPDAGINAAEGILNFNAAQLQAISISKDDSIFNLWTIEPAFSNLQSGEQGIINFGGGATKSFQGKSGKIATVKFKALRESESRVNFSSGAILAADGLGTNIIKSLNAGIYTLKPKSILPKAEYVAVSGAPQEPEIYSSTHPDPNKWYTSKNAKFSWGISDDVFEVRMAIDKNSYSIPQDVYSGAITEKEFSGLADGVWYLHLQLKNSAGFGKAAHFKIQIDSLRPSKFNILLKEREDLTNPRVKLAFDAFDFESGIDYYEAQIDGGPVINFKDGGSRIFETPVLKPGKHSLIAKAYDKAQNFLVNSLDFEIKPIAAPKIIDYPKELESGDILVVRGASAPNGKVVVWLQKDGEGAKSFEVVADAQGEFIFINSEKIQDGVYKLVAEAVDKRGAYSNPTEQIEIAVKKPKLIQFGSKAINFLAVLIPLIGLIVLMIFVIWFSWYKFSSFRKKIKKEVGEAEKALKDAFDILEKDVRDQIKILEKARAKRPLTKEEEEMINKFKKHLKEEEKIVRKEIEDIERLS